MQTFLPYADFAASAAVLDERRLGKQRVETMQILRALTWPSYRGWKNHPATAMWRGFVPALVCYGLAVCREWEHRGHPDAVAAELLGVTGGRAPDANRLAVEGRLPPWLGSARFHLSHRSALVRKSPEHYRRVFPGVPDDLPYVWPAPSFPRWPVRRPAGDLAPLPVPAAAAVAGLDPTAGQERAVAALAAGGDAVLVEPDPRAATAAGALAGLCLPGPTLWVTAPGDGDTDRCAPPLEQLRPDGPPARDGRLAASIARAPAPGDLQSLRDEAAAPVEFVFHGPDALRSAQVRRALGRPGLVVVAAADRLSDADAQLVADVRARRGRPPILAIPSEVAAVDAVAAELRLRSPLVV